MALTASLYAGDADKLFETFVLNGPHTTTPANGDSVQVWQDEITPATRDVMLADVSVPPSWASPGAMLLPSMFFDGAEKYSAFNYAGTAFLNTGNLFSSTTMTIDAAFRITATATNNANSFDNTMLVCDLGGYFGVFFKTITGTTRIYAVSYDGNFDETSGIVVSLDTDYVIRMRRDGSTLYLTLFEGAGGATSTTVSVASGTLTSTGSTVSVAKGFGGSSFFTGHIGAVETYNSDEGSSSAALTSMITAWLGAAAGGNRPVKFAGRWGGYAGASGGFAA